MRFVPRFLFALCLTLAVGSIQPVAVAQTPPEEAARFQLADTYLRSGQFDRAIAILEGLYRDNPEYAYFSKLVSAFESTKRYADAIALIDARLESDPNPVTLWSERARLLYLDQRPDEATSAWENAVAAAPDQEMTYRLVYQSIAGVREFEKASALLVRGRSTLGDSSLFHQELGYLYGMLSEHGKAMEEYLALIAKDERQLSNVKSRLGRAAGQPGVVSASVEVVERGVKSNPLNRSFRELLGWLYLEAGLYPPALETYRAIDRLESENGRVLFTFAGQASAAKAFDVALEAYTEILDKHGTRPIASEALRGKAEMHRRWANAMNEAREAVDKNGNSARQHFQLALESFEEYASRYPSSPNLPYVLLDVAQLNQDVFFRFAPAKGTLETVVARYPNHAAADRAAFQLGLLHLSEGRLDDARIQFSRLEQRLRTGDLAEQARYEIAMIHFYLGEFDAADALIAALKENTSNDTANDAIGMRVLLFEGRGPDSLSTPMLQFAHARLLTRQRQFESALETLRQMRAGYAGHALVDDALFEEAEILVELGEYESAFQLFAELPLRHPTSFLADQSLFRAAALQEDQLGNPEKAIELFNRLMTEYPGSLLAGEARMRIRMLRGDNV